jgi:hypothetical protein
MVYFLHKILFTKWVRHLGKRRCHSDEDIFSYLIYFWTLENRIEGAVASKMAAEENSQIDHVDREEFSEITLHFPDIEASFPV